MARGRPRGYARRPVTTLSTRREIPIEPLAVDVAPQLFDVPVGLAGPTTLVLLPQVVNLDLYQGDDFAFTITVHSGGAPADLSSVTVEAMVGASPRPGALLGNLVVTVDQNVILIHLTHTLSAELPTRSVWDCQLTFLGGWITTIVKGDIMLAPDVTR